MRVPWVGMRGITIDRERALKVGALVGLWGPLISFLGLPLLVATTLWVLTRPGSWAPRLLTTGIAGGTAVVFGLVPALRSTKPRR